MKSSVATSGPFRERLFFPASEIDEMCLSALQESLLLATEPGPVRIERFLEKHFGCPVIYEDLGPGFMGCTAFRSNGSIEVVVISRRLDDGTCIGECRA